jgi:hypothetical protein
MTARRRRVRYGGRAGLTGVWTNSMEVETMIKRRKLLVNLSAVAALSPWLGVRAGETTTQPPVGAPAQDALTATKTTDRMLCIGRTALSTLGDRS